MAIKTRQDEVAASIVDTTAAAVSSTMASGFEQADQGIQQTAASLNHGMNQAAAGFEQTQAKMQEGVNKAMKTAEEFVAFGQGNLEAFVKSGQIWVAGIQDMGRQAAATAQAQLQDTVSAFRALTTVRTVKDAIDVQSNLARTAIEKTMTESGRITESSIKLTEQAMAPLAARVTLAVEKFGKPV